MATAMWAFQVDGSCGYNEHANREQGLVCIQDKYVIKRCVFKTGQDNTRSGDLPILCSTQTEARECRLKKQTMGNIGSSAETMGIIRC